MCYTGHVASFTPSRGMKVQFDGFTATEQEWVDGNDEWEWEDSPGVDSLEINRVRLKLKQPGGPPLSCVLPQQAEASVMSGSSPRRFNKKARLLGARGADEEEAPPNNPAGSSSAPTARSRAIAAGAAPAAGGASPGPAGAAASRCAKEQRRRVAERAARLLAAERERVQLLEAQRRRELAGVDADARRRARLVGQPGGRRAVGEEGPDGARRRARAHRQLAGRVEPDADRLHGRPGAAPVAEPPQPRHDARDAAAAAREVEDDASAARERRRRVGAGLGRAHDLDGHVRACAETTPSIGCGRGNDVPTFDRRAGPRGGRRCASATRGGAAAPPARSSRAAARSRRPSASAAPSRAA